MVSLAVSENTACNVYAVNYSGWTSYASTYFYFGIWTEGLLCAAEHNPFAIAKFFVNS